MSWGQHTVLQETTRRLPHLTVLYIYLMLLLDLPRKVLKSEVLCKSFRNIEMTEKIGFIHFELY